MTNSPYLNEDPIYLPDGKIVFSTTRGNTYVRCLPDSSSTVLARCDADGGNIRIISNNSEPDYTPCLLPERANPLHALGVHGSHRAAVGKIMDGQPGRHRPDALLGKS